MRRIAFLITLVLASSGLFAQMPAVNQAKPGQVPNLGHVFGKIVDSAGKPLSDVSVILMQAKLDPSTKKSKEIFLKGMSTKANGEFNFEELPVMPPIKLKITATGFKAIEQTISFMPAGVQARPQTTTPLAGGMPGFQGGGAPSFDKDLGKIKLETDVAQLSNVTITATKPLVRLDADKKVFNVEKNIVSAGGTALDVMKNVPSVNVDIDGNVTLRNAAPQVYVDGRPTTLTLDQIPADAIESVEVITNPSAKYDASGGGAGILNIVLKKNRKTGYNGNVRAGVDKRGGLNGGGDFNLREGKVNFSAALMVNQMKGRTTGTTDRLNLQDSPQTSVFQENLNKTNGGFGFGKIGLDYFITNKTTLSVSGFKVHGEFKPWESISITTDSLYNSGKVAANSDRLSTGSRTFNGQGLVLGMKHLFAKEGEEWTADMNYFTGRNNGVSNYATNYYSGNSSQVYDKEVQQVLSGGNDKNFVIQTDYTKPLGNGAKFEMGLRAALRSRVNNNNTYLQDNSGQFVLVPSATSNYKNNDNVYAAYATYSGNLKDFGYKLGLRAESSNYSGELTNTGEQFKNTYPVSLFPSVFLTQKLASNQQLQLSYSRRINRPNFFQLIPFVDYTDKLNITKGNPGLVPEFTQSFELSYLKTFKGNNSLLGSLYYKRTDNLITRYLDKQTNPLTGTEDLINTYINANWSYSAGAELTAQNYLTKWWDISTNLNVYNSQIKADSNTQAALWSWFGKFNSNFKLPSDFTMQLTATYQSKTNLPVNSNQGMMGPPFGQAQSSSQGYISSSWGVDLAVKKTFLPSKALSLTLSINDIFRTRVQNQYSYSNYFIQHYNRLRDPQMIRLNLAYRFGKIDMSLFKRKNMKAEQGAGESMQQQ
ncbi:MAG: TonB-dependent receptor [Bacteroidota bacterium]|nr:TonB-dependent receptor [Bacteroidota bacterium]